MCVRRAHARTQVQCSDCSKRSCWNTGANCGSSDTKKFHSEATPGRCAGTGRNPPSSCYQKGLNRTIAVTELFGDSGTMCPKQVGNKRDEERVFFPTKLHWAVEKKRFWSTALDYCPPPAQGRCCYLRAHMAWTMWGKHLCDGFKSTASKKKTNTVKH